MRKKRLTSLVLSAAMVLTSTGISFAAQNVGKPGEVKEWGDNVWITLDASGGEFLLDVEDSATPDNATTNTASKAGTRVKTLDVGGQVSAQDGNGLYLEFKEAKPVAKSAKENWDPLRQGPENAPSGETNLEFAGWYTDKTFEDLTTKLSEESKLYGHDTVYARWVNPDQATMQDDYAKEHVEEVKVSGLKEDSKLVFAGLEEEKRKDVKSVAAFLAGTDFSSHKIAEDSSALVQLDISVDGETDGPVGITMKDPFGGKYDHVLVLHLEDDASKVKDDGIQSAVLDKEEGTISFIANGFSPYILAGVDTKMVKIKIENVENGTLVMWSEKRNEDDTYSITVVPVGEEVEIPAGTELLVEAYGIDAGESYYYLEDGCFQVVSEGKTENIREWENESYIVSEDAVISAKFVTDADEDRIFSLTPDHLEYPGFYEGTVTGSVTGDDGEEVPLTVALVEKTDVELMWSEDNDLFTLEDGVLKSKDELGPDGYFLSLKGTSPAGEVFTETARIIVSHIGADVEPNRILKSGMFEGTVNGFVVENGESIDKPISVVGFDDDTHRKNKNDLFVLEGNLLKSKETLKPGYYPVDIWVKFQEKHLFQVRAQVHVGMGSYFFAPLAQYEYSVSGETYTQYISYDFANIYEEEGALVEDAEKDFYKETEIKEIAMYGDHAFKGWVDEDGNAKVGSEKLRESNGFLASFENYTPVKVGVTDTPEDPDTPDTPAKPNRPSNSSGGSSSGGSASSSSGGNTISGEWKRDEKGWWFLLKNGDYAKNQWGKVNNVWYFFGADGYMLTGWQMINGQWYYLTETEANQGAMVTGWHYNEDYKAWFYLNSDGAMLTGWQMINGLWYYLNPVSDGTQGSMAADTYIDGYYVNADGAWVQ